MDKKLIAGGALTGLILAGGMAGMVSAQSVADTTGLSEEQIVQIALLEVPGEVQDVELENEDGMQVFEVEILTADGQEMEVEISAETGDVLEISADDEDDDHDDDDDETDDA